MLRARCPAKINLSLRVLGPRADGFHELDTVFQTVDLWDVLEAEPAGELSLVCDDARLPRDGTNLVLRAARLLHERYGGATRGARISLSKRIPLEGGLGGGSSDAAGALRLLSRLWGLELGREQLLPLAAELGADVPFFLFGGTARGRGRGDLIEPLTPLPSTPLLLGSPPFGVPTGEVFAQMRRRIADRRWAPHVADGIERPVNDLESVVFTGWPQLSTFRDALLEQGADAARLSGSGSTVFGLFSDVRTAVEAAAVLEPNFPGWRVLKTRTIEASAELVAVG